MLWKKKKTRLGMVNLFEDSGGIEKDGRFYLYCALNADQHKDPMVEVGEEIYRFYIRDVWRQEKVRERLTRCWLGNKRCKGKCSECDRERIPLIDSIERLGEAGIQWETGKEMLI